MSPVRASRAAVLALAAAVACGGGGSSEQPSSENPRNDTFETATPIALPGGGYYRIDTAGDVDFYAFAIPSQSEVSVESTGPVAVDVYDAAHTPLLHTDFPIGGGTIRHVFLAATAGTYYARVSASTPGATGEYWLQLDFTPYDGNDSFDTATPIAAGAIVDAAITARLLPVQDRDYYAFTTAAPGSVTVDLTRLGANLNLFLYDPGRVQLASSLQPGDADEHIELYLAAAGTHYLQVVGAAWATSAYRLALQFVESVDGNDSFGTATPVALPAQVNGSISSGTDVDYYRFSIPSTAGKITVDLSGLAGDLDLQLFDSGHVPLAASATPGTAGERIVHAPDSAGTYYAEIHGIGGARSNYTLAITFGGDGDESFATATPIATGVDVPGELGFDLDVDFYSFTAAGAGEIVVLLSDLADQASLSLYAADQTLVWDAWGAPSVEIQATSPGGGLYYVKVETYPGARFPYTLRVTAP